jgi:hypothetical protein
MTLYKPEVEAQKFWNPYTQTMPRAELDQLHLRKLQTAIEYAYARSPMYRKLLDRHKVKPEQIRTMDDFVKRLPFIDKKRSSTRRRARRSATRSRSEDFFHQRFATSGSTGAPLHIPLYHSAGCGAVVGLPVLGRRAGRHVLLSVQLGDLRRVLVSVHGCAPSRRIVGQRAR